MSGRIPIPDAYGMALFWVYGLSCFSLAAQLHRRWGKPHFSSFMCIHLVILGLTVTWGGMLFDARMLLGSGFFTVLAAIPIGLGLGGVALWADRQILRSMLRRRPVSQGAGAPQPLRPRALEARSEYETLDPYAPRGQLAVARRDEEAGGQGSLKWGAILLGVIAALEEIIYRGFLPRACSLLPSTSLAFVALLGVTLAFSLSHIGFGWPHVFAKMPLSFLAMASVLVLDTVVSAVVAHGLFNVITWLQRSRQPGLSRHQPAAIPWRQAF